MSIRQDYRERFEGLGLERVRSLLATGKFAGAKATDSNAWIAEQERAQEREVLLRTEASQAEQIAIARSAKDANWVAAEAGRDAVKEAKTANITAQAALAVAVIAILISTLGWLFR